MEDDEIASFIKEEYDWDQLPKHIKTKLGNAQYNYERSIVSYSIKNQLRYHGNLGCVYSNSKKAYYEDLLQYSRINLMLFPYHLSDVYVTGLRTTPFSYYIDMISELLSKEKAYDVLPNFVAADCMRLLGIGRNQYIELIRGGRPHKRPRNSKLPMQPVDPVNFEPWWKVRVGFVTVDDIKLCSEAEKSLIDSLIDNGPTEAGLMPASVLVSLYKRGLIYFDIVICDEDHFKVLFLDKFVMNRLQGDYLEVILYKIFVSIDERISIEELACLLEIDISLVKRAVSLYCRLGFAERKQKQNLLFFRMLDANPQKSKATDEPEAILAPNNGTKNTERKFYKLNYKASSDSGELIKEPSKRVGILFDSTLTAFLMMGNLSPNLKVHAVTMFEVGKLSDENMEQFLKELGNVNVIEGDAGRFVSHAVNLRYSIETLRYNKQLFTDSQNIDFGLGVDLLRCESLQNLNFKERTRFLQRNYYVLLSLAPFHFTSLPLVSPEPCHFGPPTCEFLTPWFKFFIYCVSGSGPPSLLLPRGYNFRKLPSCFQPYHKFLAIPWQHEAIIVNFSNVHTALQESLTQYPVLLQAFCLQNCTENDIESPKHFSYCSFRQASEYVLSCPLLEKLQKKLNFSDLIGYVSFIKVSHESDSSNSRNSLLTDDANHDDGDTKSQEDFQDHCDNLILLDVTFGLPLFNTELNSACLEQIISSRIFSTEGMEKYSVSRQKMEKKFSAFICKHFQPDFKFSDCSSALWPSRPFLYYDGELSRL